MHRLNNRCSLCVGIARCDLTHIDHEVLYVDACNFEKLVIDDLLLYDFKRYRFAQRNFASHVTYVCVPGLQQQLREGACAHAYSALRPLLPTDEHLALEHSPALQMSQGEGHVATPSLDVYPTFADT
jgi:hypothetical protein